MCASGAYADSAETFVKRVQLKQKPDEFAKPGKYARITCDLGTPASLRAGWLPDVIKTAMADTPLLQSGVEVVFVKTPDPKRVGELFRAMYSRPMWLYHSDDATMSLPVRRAGAVTLGWFNVDISGCDASCSERVADLLLLCTPATEVQHMQVLIQQLRAPCALGYGPGRMLFRPHKIFEYSGSVLTTALNNCSALTCAAYVAQRWPTPDESVAAECLHRLLRQAGWECSVEQCVEFEDVQFLKQSPVRKLSGEWGAMLNLGVLLRAVGQCRYDLPGSGPFEERAHAHACAVVRGMLPGGRNPVIDAYYEKFPHGVAVEAFYGFPTVGVGPRFEVTSMLKRYGMSIPAMEHFLECLSRASVGDLIDTPFSRAVLRRDYGY